MPKVIFRPSNVEVTVKKGSTLLKAAQRAGVEVTWCCGGNAICTTCRCVIKDGMENLSPVEETEQDFLVANKLFGSWRLACQAKVLGDVVSWIPTDLSKVRPGLEPILEEARDLETRAAYLRDHLRAKQREPEE